MHSLLLRSVGVIACSLVLASAAYAAHDEDFWHGYLFETELTAAEETHDATPAMATAHAGAWFAGEGTAMNYWLSVFSEEPVTGAHFHCGSPGEDGPIVVHLGNKNPGGSGKMYGEIGRGYLTNDDIELSTSLDCEHVIGYPITDVTSLASAMINGHIYANIHSATHPAGSARGQLEMYPGWRH